MMMVWLFPSTISLTLGTLMVGRRLVIFSHALRQFNVGFIVSIVSIYYGLLGQYYCWTIILFSSFCENKSKAPNIFVTTGLVLPFASATAVLHRGNYQLERSNSK